MKKFLFAIPVGMLSLCMSCSDNGGGKNLDAARAINKAVETGDTSKLSDYLAADAVDHSDHGDIKGADSIKSAIAKIHLMVKDMKIETVKELADGEYTFQWMNYTGTAITSDMGMKAGETFKMTAIQVSKFKDGKSTEHWEFMQPADMMKMMSAMGAGSNMNNKMNDKMGHKDSTK